MISVTGIVIACFYPSWGPLQQWSILIFPEPYFRDLGEVVQKRGWGVAQTHMLAWPPQRSLRDPCLIALVLVFD